jgi:hypothetical protein
MFGDRAHNIALRQDAGDPVIGAPRMTTAPMRSLGLTPKQLLLLMRRVRGVDGLLPPSTLVRS